MLKGIRVRGVDSITVLVDSISTHFRTRIYRTRTVAPRIPLTANGTSPDTRTEEADPFLSLRSTAVIGLLFSNFALAPTFADAKVSPFTAVAAGSGLVTTFLTRLGVYFTCGTAAFILTEAEWSPLALIVA
jgi:hypothetical protein